MEPRSPAQGVAGQRVHLTSRQLEVLALLCEGLPNKLISRQLNISAATVSTHISNILGELGVSSRLQAVVVAQRHDLLGQCDAGDEGDADVPNPEVHVPVIVPTSGPRLAPVVGPAG